MKNTQIFGQNHGLTPLQKSNFVNIQGLHFYGLKWLVSYSEHHQTLLYGFFK